MVIILDIKGIILAIIKSKTRNLFVKFPFDKSKRKFTHRQIYEVFS